MTVRFLGLALAAALSLTPTLGAAPSFLEEASALLNQGQVDQAGALARTVLSGNPDDADALVVAGTAVLYQNLRARPDDSIFRPETNPKAPPTQDLTPAGADAVAAYWKRVPALDPTRAYLWGDLAQMTFRAGDGAHALEYAQAALDAGITDPEALDAVALVFALNLDWNHAAAALEKVPGNRTALLYRGLELWRTGQDGWRPVLKDFAANPGPQKAGAALAAYLVGPAMRDTEAGFQAAAGAEATTASLAVLQKYVDRYPDRLVARLNLARTLSQYGSYAKALVHYGEIDRRALATTPDQKQTVLFQEAWAYQASGRIPEAANLWKTLAESRDFFVRSAAAWFLGQEALGRDKPQEARFYWTRRLELPPVQPEKTPPAPPEFLPAPAEMPAGSKYAYWARVALAALPAPSPAGAVAPVAPAEAPKP